MLSLRSKPELKDLSQGSRIAFVRQLRHLSQDSVSDYLGLTGECKRRSMTRYEKGDRNPKDERVRQIAKLLNVSFNSLKKYDYNSAIRLTGYYRGMFAFCFNIATFLATILLLALLYDINKQNKTKQGVKND